MKGDLDLVFLYIAGFGFSDMLVEYFEINNNLKKFLYFSFMLLIALVLHFFL